MVTSWLRHFEEVGLPLVDCRCPSVEFYPSVELRPSVEWLKMTFGARAAPIYNFFWEGTSTEVYTSTEVNTSVEVFTNPRSRFWYIDRGLVNTSTEGWNEPRSRASKNLGRGINTSVEGLTSPRPRYVFLILAKCACQKVLPRSMDSPK